MHLSCFPVFIKRNVGMIFSLHTKDRKKWSTPFNVLFFFSKGVIHMYRLLIIPAFERYLWQAVIIHIQLSLNQTQKARDHQLITSNPWEILQLGWAGGDKSINSHLQPKRILFWGSCWLGTCMHSMFCICAAHVPRDSFDYVSPSWVHFRSTICCDRITSW